MPILVTVLHDYPLNASIFEKEASSNGGVLTYDWYASLFQ